MNFKELNSQKWNNSGWKKLFQTAVLVQLWGKIFEEIRDLYTFHPMHTGYSWRSVWDEEGGFIWGCRRWIVNGLKNPDGRNCGIDKLLLDVNYLGRGRGNCRLISSERLTYGHCIFLSQHNYREMRELPNPFNRINYNDTLESANLLILSKTCNGGNRNKHEQYSGSPKHQYSLGSEVPTNSVGSSEDNQPSLRGRSAQRFEGCAKFVTDLLSVAKQPRNHRGSSQR